MMKCVELNHKEHLSAVTDFGTIQVFQNNDGPIEFDMGKIIVDAAIKAGVQCFVFSSGPPCTEMTNGEVQMKAMDSEYYLSYPIERLSSY